MTDAEKVAILEKRLNERDEEVEFLKKYMPSLQNCKISPKQWYETISIACKDGKRIPYKLCKAAGVEPSGYYHFVRRKSKASTKIIKDSQVLADIQFLQTKHKQTLGYRQVTMQLNRFYKKHGLDVVNCKRVGRLMR